MDNDTHEDTFNFTLAGPEATPVFSLKRDGTYEWPRGDTPELREAFRQGFPAFAALIERVENLQRRIDEYHREYTGRENDA